MKLGDMTIREFANNCPCVKDEVCEETCCIDCQLEPICMGFPEDYIKYLDREFEQNSEDISEVSSTADKYIDSGSDNKINLTNCTINIYVNK